MGLLGNLLPTFCTGRENNNLSRVCFNVGSGRGKKRKVQVKVCYNIAETIVFARLRFRLFACSVFLIVFVHSDQQDDTSKHSMVFTFHHRTTDQQLVDLINGSTLVELTGWLGGPRAAKVDEMKPVRNISQLKISLGNRGFMKAKKQLLGVLGR